MTGLSTSYIRPTSTHDMRACLFTSLSRHGMDECRDDYTTNRALRGIRATPIFRHPKVWMTLVKSEHVLSNGNTLQTWWPWQVCANCIAVRAKGYCSLYMAALRHVDPALKIHMLEPRQQSATDCAYGWFTDKRDLFMDKDIGYYNMWLSRAGKESRVVGTCSLSCFQRN